MKNNKSELAKLIGGVSRQYISFLEVIREKYLH